MSFISPVPDRDGLIEAYAYPDGRTWVRANFVSTVDGAATSASGLSAGISPEIDRRVFAILRSLADVILVGAGTTRHEGYEPVRPDEVDGALRESLGLAPRPPIAVVSASLDLPEALVRKDSTAAPTIVITSAAAPADRLAHVREHCDVVVVGEQTVDLAAIRPALSERGLNRVLCEGGPSLFGALVEADVVDELCLTIAPRLAADGAPRIAIGSVAVDRRLRLEHLLYEDDVLLARYVRDRSTT
ncbi:pyrimidine reductase family protein [Solicola gregarius]|uniref:Pyrimidine reductase family protein n=1 Tax=Solicola gregarius TaxID=2908642 RepID=A0AA46TGL6_9ACTN|nr:pyrimidine reductase family protein [Solicola gregarius]UYM04775.1 pyrimidine reductase family protein [Solicola gregarius]